MARMADADREAGLARLEKQFMVPEIYRGHVWEISANHGETHWVPGDIIGYLPDPVDARSVLAAYVDGTIDADSEPIYRRGVWLARLTAPGYMDCTDWSVCSSRRDAEEYLVEMYDDYDDEA